MKIPENIFLYINLFIALIYLIEIIVSYKKGLVYEIVHLILKLVSIYASYKLCIFLTSQYPLINLDLGAFSLILDVNSITNHVLWFIICFFVLQLVIALIMPLFKFVSKIPVVGIVNKVGGVLVGILCATLTVLCLSFVLSLPVIQNCEEVKEKTVIKYISNYSNQAYNYFIDNVDVKGFINDIELKAIIEKIDISEYEDNQKIMNYLNELGVDSIKDIELNDLTLSQKTKLLELFVLNHNE